MLALLLHASSPPALVLKAQASPVDGAVFLPVCLDAGLWGEHVLLLCLCPSTAPAPASCSPSD